MLSRCSLGISLLAALLALPGDAAAGLIQIEYDVTGGTFDGPNSTGAITGGTLSFQALTTGSNTMAAGSVLNAVLTKLTLAGPAGSFRFFGGGTVVKNTATFTQLFASFTESRSDPAIITGMAGLMIPADKLFVGFTANTGVATAATASGLVNGATFDHRFRLGGESRVVLPVPEPGSGLLLAMGLSGLAVAGRKGRSRFLARRRARESGYSR